MLDLQPFSDFESAAQATLEFLHQRLGFDLWMVTRTEGDDWIVLQAKDNGYGVQKSAVLRWADSLCSQMVQGQGPRIAPCSDDVEAYTSAPINQTLQISAYIGAPLTCPDGSLFGTLCAVHPESHQHTLHAELPMVELCAQLLSSVLHLELRLAEADRHKERAESEALIDPLTGLYNRRGWEKLVSAEEIRCRRYGHSACVLILDLDGLKQVNDEQGHQQGDALIQLAGHTIQNVLRESDVAARIGGDEFAVLGVECDELAADVLKRRLMRGLIAAGVGTSIGVAVRDRQFTLADAFAKADEAMYTMKRSRYKLSAR
ncbi:sensor domain-containing diguanylate cyclase [filamentous cyanobacterium LEGE 11480]|uniref:Sensor domain-containing diguanylate cyclase n=1 Tax=Romeriopsis navalis LEGE 11480 TaxID=2777977 RepID=A0A928VMF8_9CYAN|nr:sensor domain-containing diguanylate cyclase [Romeriopsis navalis]MBE9029077.1 sensor domain-containing diguanylate cyclase [Romeriopsis navalis LEGE 11480]